MKKTLLITIALGASFLLASNANAQKANTPAKKEAAVEKRDNAMGAQDAEKETAKLTSYLGLNPGQSQKMKAALTTYYDNLNKIEDKYHNQKPAPPAEKTEKKENTDKLHSEAKTFLTPEQYEKYIKSPNGNAEKKPATK